MATLRFILIIVFMNGDTIGNVCFLHCLYEQESTMWMKLLHSKHILFFEYAIKYRPRFYLWEFICCLWLLSFSQRLIEGHSPFKRNKQLLNAIYFSFSLVLSDNLPRLSLPIVCCEILISEVMDTPIMLRMDEHLIMW